MSTVNFKHGLEHTSEIHLRRFEAKIAANDDCWLWMGTRDSDGYGVFKIAGKMHKAHRLAFKFAFGWLPSRSHFICHKCDERACVNPAHLFAGLPSDNSFDMVSKGRSAKGERDGASRLTEADVRDILFRLELGEAKRAIARRYSVSDTAIRSIARGKTWRHVSLEVA